MAMEMLSTEKVPTYMHLPLLLEKGNNYTRPGSHVMLDQITKTITLKKKQFTNLRLTIEFSLMESRPITVK
jgi:hypothetical protein